MDMKKCDDGITLEEKKRRERRLVYEEGYADGYRIMYKMMNGDLLECVDRMFSNNLDVQLISEIVDMPVEKVEELKKEFDKYN